MPSEWLDWGLDDHSKVSKKRFIKMIPSVPPGYAWKKVNNWPRDACNHRKPPRATLLGRLDLTKGVTTVVPAGCISLMVDGGLKKTHRRLC